ncbi:MAG: hypothetical protein H0T75_12305 [Rhizobiales bacterium]|nr:hypothetical protein [Hyphomicrobiales bacterium]MDQ3560105.1 hypothetical protein [Pseudomonadota bacterium]
MEFPILDLLSLSSLALLAVAAAFTVQKLVKKIHGKRLLAEALARSHFDEFSLPSVLLDLRELEEADPTIALQKMRLHREQNPLFQAISEMNNSVAIEVVSALTQPSDHGRERYIRDLLQAA